MKIYDHVRKHTEENIRGISLIYAFVVVMKQYVHVICYMTKPKYSFKQQR
jgi:hypothetical protein